MSSSTKKPWLQLPAETTRQFTAFEVYRTLGADRSLRAAYATLYQKPAAKEAPEWFRAWAKRNKWTVRVRAYDEWVQEQQLEAERKAIEEEVKKAVEMRKKAYTGLIGTGMQIISKAEVAHLRPYEARRLLRVAVTAIDTGAKGQRVELGEPASIEEQRVSGQHIVDVEADVVTTSTGGDGSNASGGVDLDQLADFIVTLQGAGLIGPALTGPADGANPVGQGSTQIN